MVAITLNIIPRGRPIKKLPPSVELELDTATAETLYTTIAAKVGYPKSQLRITKGHDGTFIPLGGLDGKSALIKDFGLRDGSNVHVKDLGKQVGWRTTFITEYFGPIFIHPAFLYLRDYLYSNSAYNPLSYIPGTPAVYPLGTLPPPTQSQYLLCALIMLHFIKREYETVCVHRFSAATMPFGNLIKNTTYYWVLSGVNLGYFLYHPASVASWWPAALNPDKNPAVMWAAAAVWLWAELSNYATHMTLRNLRPADQNTQRQVPKGYGFNLVTCPNYLFESLGWAAITFLAGGNWAAALFLAVGTGQMAAWAKKKEKRYRKEFGSSYKKKSSMFPGIW